jgi:hypothetical protein
MRAFYSAIGAICLFAPWTTLTTPARADDQPFLSLYMTDIDSQGEREVEQWLGWKAGETAASYNDVLSRTEFEYGITDNLQGSLYLNYEWGRVRSHQSPISSETESSVGVSGELIWRLLNSDFDPFGLALYVEPSWNTDEREVESKILLQKNFLNDVLRCAFNINFEDDWDHEGNGWDRDSALEFDAGVAYTVTPELSAGLEFDNERTFEGLVMGGASREQASAYFLGPTIDYEPLPWKITLGAQAQLPWATSPTGNPGAVIGGFEARAERFRVELRLSRDF